MKIKTIEYFGAIKIIGEDKEVFLVHVDEFELREIEDMISEYGDEVKVKAYSNYCAGRLNISFGVKDFIFCVSEETVYSAKRILNI